MDYISKIKEYIALEIETLQSLDHETINECINVILKTRDNGGVIYTLGNGGSAATASHMVCDFAKGASERLEGNKFKFECLCDNTPIVMAIANDISYDDIFVFQLRDKLSPNDLVIAISGSGNSKNVIKAVEFAKSVGTPVIGMTGYDGGKLYQLADYNLHVNIDDMQITEDIHMIFDHMFFKVLTTGIA